MMSSKKQSPVLACEYWLALCHVLPRVASASQSMPPRVSARHLVRGCLRRPLYRCIVASRQSCLLLVNVLPTDGDVLRITSGRLTSSINSR
ncbi:hypothetical protein F4861DRAFT_342646 [Xylaria intraflava]|nr:hypothetical protein F4861DRAFT_342646 [Xylaria intraflava]